MIRALLSGEREIVWQIRWFAAARGWRMEVPAGYVRREVMEVIGGVVPS